MNITHDPLYNSIRIAAYSRKQEHYWAKMCPDCKINLWTLLDGTTVEVTELKSPGEGPSKFFDDEVFLGVVDMNTPGTWKGQRRPHMNWSDIKRSLDSEFNRLETERVKQFEQDEKLSELVMESEIEEERVYIVEPTLDPRLVTVVKGSSVEEFKQNWKEKVEAN